MLMADQVGEKIAIARKLKNLSQAQLAEQLAVSAQAVGKWERGESMPDILTFTRLAEALGTDLNYFVGATACAQNPVVPPEDEGAQEQSEAPGWNMSGGNWADADFSGLHGLAEKFRGTNIEQCRFIGSELAGLTLRGNNIERSDFSQSDLRRCALTGSNLEGDTFAGCDFSGSTFTRCNAEGCDFSAANLTGVALHWCHLRRSDFTGAVLQGTLFRMGQLTEITLGGILVDCAFENCDFSKVTFEGAVLRNCFFKNAKLKRVKFVDCQADRLTYAFMKNSKADMSGVTVIEE
ncbi:MAG: pentapeptide repeat-containing protein [Oscillospiraceae bacterium]|nr:pentapeptide repeat-containing protein [Oscillospiraceae bacterium]